MGRLAAKLMQERFNHLRRWRREFEYWLNVNIRKTQPRETRAERLTNVFGGGARHFQKRSKNRFVVGLRKSVCGEAVNNCGASLAIERRRAKRREEPTLDFRGREMALRFVHSQKLY